MVECVCAEVGATSYLRLNCSTSAETTYTIGSCWRHESLPTSSKTRCVRLAGVRFARSSVERGTQYPSDAPTGSLDAYHGHLSSAF